MILQLVFPYPAVRAALLKAAVRDVAGVVPIVSHPAVWDSRRPER